MYFSDQGQALEERVGGVTKAHYVWSPVYVNALVLRDRDADGNPANGLEERLYAQQDANWNVTALVNTSAAVVERYAYLSFGQVTVLTAGWSVLPASAYGFVYQFQGLRLGAATGIYYARARDLSPTKMRWQERDPLELQAGDPNVYRVLGNNPANNTDPSGLAYDWKDFIPLAVVVPVFGPFITVGYAGYRGYQLISAWWESRKINAANRRVILEFYYDRNVVPLAPESADAAEIKRIYDAALAGSGGSAIVQFVGLDKANLDKVTRAKLWVRAIHTASS